MKSLKKDRRTDVGEYKVLKFDLRTLKIIDSSINKPCILNQGKLVHASRENPHIAWVILVISSCMLAFNSCLKAVHIYVTLHKTPYKTTRSQKGDQTNYLLIDFLLTIMTKSENSFLKCMGNQGRGVITKTTTEILEVIFKLSKNFKLVPTLYRFPNSYHRFYFVERKGS